MPIYRVNNTTYNIPDDMSVKFEQRFPNAKIDMYNGEEKYSIPVNEKNNFVKAYPKATFEYQGNDISSQEQPSNPVQDFQPRQEVKDYALNNIPDMFKSKGNNLSTHPLQTQEDFSGGTSDSMKRRIEQAKRATNDQYMRQFAIEQVFKPKGEKLSTRPLQTQEDFFGETLDFMNRIATDENQRIEQAERAANDPYMRQQEIEHVFKPKNQEQINTVRNLIEEQNKRLDKRLSIHSGSGNNAFNALANSTRYNRETSDDRNQKAVLGYAEKLIEQAQNITDEAKRKGNTNFLAGFYRGFRDTPLDVWAMGLANLRDYAVANQVMDKVDKGEKLNPAEDALMQALVTNAATQMYYAGDLGRGYKAGGAIHESLPFMLDMLLGMGTIQAVTKPAAKSLLKYATEKAVKYGLGKATTGLAKGAARTISGLRDVAAHTATFGSQRVAADYLRRGLGDIQVKPNEDGTVSYDGRENIQTGGEAIGKAIVSTAAETGSELLGEYFGPMLGWIGRATGANRIGKIIPSSVGKAYSSLVNSQGFKQVQEIARRAKIADPIGEYSEEVVNNLISTAIGDMTPEQLVDLDQNIDTFLGVAPMSALFGAAGTAGYLRGQYRNYRNMRQFENRMQEEMGEDWSGVREALQDADIETAREMVKDVLSSDMTPQFKKDAITYISSVLQEQTLQNVDKQSMPEDIAQAKRDIFTNLSNTRRQIPLSDEQLDEVISRVESQGKSALEEMGFTPEQQDVIMSYNDAYQDYNNYTFWVQDMAQNARRQAEQQVESLTNATTGTVMRVKAGFSQEPVNILRGNVVFDGNGNVDAEKSDKVIYYLDKDGKVQMSPVTSIRSLIDETPAEEVAAQAGTDAENEVLQSEEAQVNPPIELGTVFSHNGQNYVVGRKTPDGYEIAAVDESGELIPEAGTQEVSEEDLRNAMNAGQSSDKSRPEGADDVGIAQEQPAITETQPESPVQGESSETSQEQEPQTALSHIPANDKGEQDFEAAPAEDTGAALMEISEGDIDDAKDTANQMILSYQEQLKKADKMKTTGASIQEIVKLKQEKKAAIRQINDKIRYWQSVSDAIEKKRPGGIIAEAKKVSDENQQRLASMTPQEQSEAQSKVQENIDKGVYDRPSQKRAKTRYVKEDNELGQANTPMEHVLREIATGRVSFLWNDNGTTQGLGKHLGYSDSSAERKKLIWAFSNETGMTPEAASEAIHADMPENLQGMVTDQDIFNMIVQAFQEYGSPSKMWKAAKEMHGTDEIESMPGYRQDIERQALEWEASENNMTVQEWIAYCDFIEEELDNMFSSVSDEELNTIFEQINDDYERRNETESAGSTQGQADSKQSDEILPASESDNTGAGEESREQPERTAETDGEGGGVVPEQAGTEQERVNTEIEKARSEIDQNPTEAQKEAGNYRKGHVKIDGFNVTIENPKGSVRSGKNISADSTEDIKREVEKTAYKLNVPVEVITSTDQIKDESVRKAIESGRKIKGWYSLSDRKVYVYLPNTSSVEDARQTILHEGVAHFGLRKLVGDENMDSFLDEIFANVTKEVREEIISTIPRYGWDSRVATEEYLASMAENGADVTVWQRIRQAFKNLLRKLGIRIEINDNELRYILWRSSQNLESGNVIDMAKDIAMQYEMGVGNYYREVEQTPEQSTVDAWDKIASSTMFNLRESAVDYLTAVDKFQELISKRSGEEIKPFENAYDSMTFLSSKNRVEMDWFDSNIVTPMRKAILALVGKQKGRKWDWGKGELRRLVMYVEAKHGTERNRQMAVEKFIKEFRPESLKFFENAGISIDRKKYDEELDSIKEKARKKAYEKSFRKIYDNLVKEGTQKEEAEKEAKKRADAIALIAELNASEKFWNDSRDKLMKEYTEKFMSEWNDIKKRISEKKDMSWIEKQKELDKEASRLGADLTQDYSGLSSVFGDENTYPQGWYEESMNFVDEYEKSHEKKDIDGLWKSISDATGYTLNKQYESGLVSKEYVETQKKRFENYIPLRGFQDEIAGDVYNYIGNDFYPGSNPVKSAGGRTSEPGNPFGSILNTGYSTISVGNKNLAKMSFFSLVNNHDTEGLAVAGRAWAVKYDRLLEDEELRKVLVMPDLKEGEEIPEWVEAVPKYPDSVGYNTNDGSKSRTSPVTDMSSEDVARLLGKFEEVMKKNSKEGYAKPISKKSKIAYRTLYNERSEHEIPLFILGNKYVITITGNPRVAQAMNGLLNPNVNNKGWSEIGEKVQRFMAGAITAKNAAFSIGNVSKDSIYANNQVFIKENTSYWLRFTKNQKGGFGDFIPMMIRLKNYRDGKLDMSDKSDVMFKEFMDNGGATGYTFVDTQEKYAKELADKLKELSRKKPGMIDPRKITKAFFDSVEFTGQAAELVNRFAAYRTSREMGRSVNRSIRDAKEITVNFNRKGAGMKSWNDNKSVFNPLNTAAFLSQYGRSYILFWNANMQEKYRFYRNIKEHPIKTTTTLIGNSMLFASVLIPFMNNFALPALYEMFGCGSEDDDEDYYNVLTDFERTRNICVRLPHGNWLKIPLSPNMSPWFTMGDCIGGAITGQRELSASDFIKAGIDAISPLSINWSYEGSNIVLNVPPTIFQPGAQIAMNVNFMGNPIRKQPFTMRQGFAPKYTMVYGNTSPTLIELSRLSNRLTGGNDRKTSGSLDWNPADIQNLITGYTGGYGSSFLSAADWIVSTLKGEEQSTTIGKMPLVSRFFISGNKDVKVRRVNSSFYDVIRFTEEFKFDRKSLEDEIQNSLKEGNKEKAMQSRKDLEELLNSDRAKKFIELESIVEAAKDFDRYMKEIPEDENTKEIIYEIKMKGIERLKQK